MSALSADVVLLMILIALVVGAVLLLNRSHRRTDETLRGLAQDQRDADLRRLREDLRLVADRRILRVVDRILSLPGSRTSSDRARSELMEPPRRDRAA